MTGSAHPSWRSVDVLSSWFLIMSRGPARAGFLGPGRITLGAHFGRVDGDSQSARGSLLKTAPKVSPNGCQSLH